MTIIDDFAAGDLPYRRARYHEGNLARDRKQDKGIAAVADRMQELADKDWVVTSPCGHPRWMIHGTGKVRLVQRHESNGRFAYVAVLP